MRAWVVEALLFLIYFAFGMSWVGLTLVGADVQATYQLDKVQLASLFSFVGAAKSFVPMLAGFLVVRLGLKHSLWVASMFCALSLVVPFAPNYLTMLWLRFFFGVGGALVITLTGPMVMQLFPRERLPLINGINNVAVNSGIVAALQVVPQLQGSWDWRSILAAIGVLSVVLSVLWFFLGVEVQTQSKEQPKASFWDVARRRETWLLGLAFSGPLALYLALNSTLPSHFQLAFGLDAKQAASLTKMFNLVGIPTAILSGFFTGKLGLRRPLIIGAGLLMPISALGLCFAPVQALRVASAVALGISFFLYVAPLFTIPMELPGSNAAFVARLNGVVISVAYLLASLSPMVLGALYEKTHTYGGGLVLFSLTSSLLAVGGFLLPETGPRGRQAEPQGHSLNRA